MAEFATVDDVAARYEGVIPAERHEWLGTRLADAEQMVRDEVPSLDARLADGRLAPETVTRVVCDMVLALLRNPSGYTSQTAGEFSYSYAGTPGGAGGILRLSAADRRLLGGRSRAYTIPATDEAIRRPHRPPVNPEGWV